jgi:hypothetical protein
MHILISVISNLLLPVSYINNNYSFRFIKKVMYLVHIEELLVYFVIYTTPQRQRRYYMVN